MKKVLLGLLAATAMIPAAASASEGGFSKSAGDFIMRGRAIVVTPDEAIGTTPNIAGNLEIDNSVVPELDFTYFLTDNLAVEVIAGVTPHDVNLNGSTLSDLDLGNVWLLPPTVTLQYHFDPMTSANIMPYVGAGVNYTHFFGADDWVSPIGKVSYGSSWGGALQAGVDIPLGGNWAFNADVKKIWITPDVTVVTTTGTRVDANVDINPWVVGLGVAYKF